MNTNNRRPEDTTRIRYDMEYEPNPKKRVLTIAFGIWITIVIFMYLILDFPFAHAVLWGSLTFGLLYFGFLYKYFWNYTDRDKIQIVEKIFGNTKAGSTSESITNTITISKGVRALAPGLNAILFERKLGDEIDTTQTTLCTVTIPEVKDNTGNYFTVSLTAPLAPITGRFAARRPFVDNKAAESFYRSLFQREVVRGFGLESGDDINSHPEEFSKIYLNGLLGGDGKVVDDEIRYASVAGNAYITSVEPIASTLAIRQIQNKGKVMNEVLERLTKEGKLPPDQALLLAAIAAGEHVDFNQLNFGGMIAAMQGRSINQGGQGGQSNRKKRKGGNQGGNQGATP